MDHFFSAILILKIVFLKASLRIAFKKQFWAFHRLRR
jgi:hypothetical protein